MMHTDISLWGRHTPAQEVLGPSVNLYSSCWETLGRLLYGRVKVLLTGGQQLRSFYSELFVRPFTWHEGPLQWTTYFPVLWITDYKCALIFFVWLLCRHQKECLSRNLDPRPLILCKKVKQFPGQEIDFPDSGEPYSSCSRGYFQWDQSHVYHILLAKTDNFTHQIWISMWNIPHV